MTDPRLGSQNPSLFTSLSSEQAVALALTVVCITTSISVFLAGVWSMESPAFIRPRYTPIIINTPDTVAVDICFQSRMHLRGSNLRFHGLPRRTDVPSQTDYPAKYGIYRQQIDDMEDDDESLAIARAEADAYRRAYYNAMWSPLLEIGICILVLAYLNAVATQILHEITQLAFGLLVAFNVVIYYPLHCCTAMLIVPAIKHTYTCCTLLLRVFAVFASWICQ